MNKMLRKLKKSNKVLRVIYYLINIAYIISFFFFLISILSLTGIETILRIIVIVFFILYFVIYSFGNLLNLLQRKYKALIITSIISLIFITCFSVGSYYINFVYKNINNMTENKEIVYSSYLITLVDTKLDSKSQVGMISKKVHEDDYLLAENLYKENNLKYDIKDYDDYFKMMHDLYDGKIDAIIVPGNYIALFSNEDGFEDITNKTKEVYEYSEKKKNEDLEIVSNKDFKDPLTFLLLGVDSEKNGLKENAGFNGDTLMVVTLNPNTLDVTMLGIPRDTYVPIACKNNNYAKINSSAAYGTNCVISTINQFLDINIDYYVKINFKGVVELVDALGGIEVDIEKPYSNTYNGKVCEQNSDRQFGSKLVCMEPGLQTINGEQALAYARNRKLYIGGDLDRVRHQQQVVEAIATKAMHFGSINDFQKILSAISNNLATNMDTDTMLSGYQLVKNMVGNILTGDDLLSINKAYLETFGLYVYEPRHGRNTSAQGYYESSLEEIKKALKVTLGKEKEEAIKTFSFSVNEQFEIPSPGKGSRKKPSASLLPNFVGKSVSEAENFCKQNNISLSVKYVDSGEYYNPSVSVGLIGYQSEHKDVLLSTVKNLTVYVVNSKKEEEPKKEDNSNTNKDPSKDNNSSDENKKDENIIEDMIS